MFFNKLTVEILFEGVRPESRVAGIGLRASVKHGIVGRYRYIEWPLDGETKEDCHQCHQDDAEDDERRPGEHLGSDHADAKTEDQHTG